MTAPSRDTPAILPMPRESFDLAGLAAAVAAHQLPVEVLIEALTRSAAADERSKMEKD